MAALSRGYKRRAVRSGNPLHGAVSHYLRAGWPHCMLHGTTLTPSCKKIGAHALLNYLDSRKKMCGEWARVVNDGAQSCRWQKIVTFVVSCKMQRNL